MDENAEKTVGTDGPAQEPAQPKAPMPWDMPDFRNSENQNLVPLLENDPKGQEWMKKFALRIIQDKKDDEASNESYYEHCAEAVELYAAETKEFKNGPAEGEMRPCLPTLAKIVQRIVARTTSVVNNTEPVAVPTGDEDNERAIRIAQHISWEKRSKHPEWKPGMSVAVLLWCLLGSVIRKVTWDPIKRRKEMTTLTPEELIMPYTDKDYTPQLEKVERTTEIIHLPKWKLRKLGQLGYFHGVDKLFDEKNPSEKAKTVRVEPGKIREAVNSIQGTEPNTDAKGTLYRFFERQSWEELPGDEENPRRISCIMEESTKRIVRLVIKEQENPADALRYQNEITERSTEIDNENGVVAVPGEPISPASKAQAEQEVKPPLMEPIYDYIHYPFSPNPYGGIYGFGAWLFVGGLNEVANVLAGEDIVAKRMASVAGSTGFIDEQLEIKKGDFKLKYGQYTPVKAISGNLANSIMPMPFTPPRANALEWLEKLDTEAQSVMSSSDYQSGMPGPSHETAAAAKLRVAAGSTAITQAIEMFLVPLAIEYKQYARLNATYMNDTEYFMVTVPQPTGDPAMMAQPSKKKRVAIGREDYLEDFDITFDSDTRLRVDPGLGQNALQAYAMILGDPDLQGEANLRMAARKKALKALECPDLAAMLPDEVPPPPPPTPQSQEDENAGFMMEQDHPVLPDDDHENHNAVMEEFKGQDLYAQLTPTGKQLFDRHHRAHKAALYKMGTDILSGKPPTVGPQPVGGPPMPGPALPPKAKPPQQGKQPPQKPEGGPQ